MPSDSLSLIYFNSPYIIQSHCQINRKFASYGPATQVLIHFTSQVTSMRQSCDYMYLPSTRGGHSNTRCT